jgi:N-acetylneuraminic acid mutarotase
MLYCGGYWFMDDIGIGEEEGKFDFTEEYGIQDAFFLGLNKLGNFVGKRTKNPMN